MWSKPIGLVVTLALGSSWRRSPPRRSRRRKCTGSVGSVLASPLPEPTLRMEAFRQGLRDLGYVEGQNLVIEYRYAEGSAERLPDLAAELVRLQVDVIVAGGSRRDPRGPARHAHDPDRDGGHL